jgi:hypothetical protein
MIAPATTDLEVTRRVTFLGETAGLDERDRRDIVWLNVGLKTVELEFGERATHYSAQPIAHEALALEARECVVAKIAAAKCAEDNVGEIDHTDDLARPGSANQESSVLGLGHSRDVATELRRRGRCSNPRMVKCATGSCESQELSLIRESGSPKKNARHLCALRLN